MGLAFAFWQIPTLPTMRANVKEQYRCEEHTVGLVSGLWTTMYALGQVVGPFYGSFIVQATNFTWFSLITSFAIFTLGCCSQPTFARLIASDDEH